jgi:hypothetical protein
MGSTQGVPPHLELPGMANYTLNTDSTTTIRIDGNGELNPEYSEQGYTELEMDQGTFTIHHVHGGCLSAN